MLKLHGYYRSSAAFRVRIALELKNLHWDSIPVNLGSGEQSLENFLKYKGGSGFISSSKSIIASDWEK